MSRDRVILASSSPRRCELLNRAGLDFSIIPARAAEEHFPGKPEKTVLYNSRLKVDEVAAGNPNALVIGADTIVYHGGILGKPANLAEAAGMLRELAGKEHGVFSGISVRTANGEMTAAAISRVRFLDFDDSVIERYFQRVDPLDKAGAYAIQEHGDMLIACIAGSYSNVIGLPLETLADILDRLGEPNTEEIRRLARSLRPPGGIRHIPG